MPSPESYELYKAYVLNVKGFLKTEKEFRRIINKKLKENRLHNLDGLTKMYALLYSTFSEANFMKLILTPYGFSQDFIDQIINQNSIQDKWNKCIDLAFHVYQTNWSGKKQNEIPNKKQRLKTIIERYIVSPSIIRNKIAHGQISEVLNSKQTKLNSDLTFELNNLTQVKIYIWFEVQKKLSTIIEDLVESPDKEHIYRYHTKIQELESYIDKTSNWTIESKLATEKMSKKKPPITIEDNVISTSLCS